MKQKVRYKSICSIFLTAFIFNFLLSQFQFLDIESFLMGVKPFEDDIDASYLNVIYDDEQIRSIKWYDQDSTMFSKEFH